MTSVVGVVPVRYGSTRWPGKALVPVDGRPMAYWAWNALRRARGIDAAVIATDDDRIAAWAVGVGAEVIRTSAACRNGTERVAETARMVPADVYVNVQADQVGLEPAAIERLAELMLQRPELPMATLGTPSIRPGDRESRDVVFVESRGVVAGRFRRGGPGTDPAWLRHLGAYAYRRDALAEYAAAEPAADEVAESLEQLRAVALGWTIGLDFVETAARSFDRPPEVPVRTVGAA